MEYYDAVLSIIPVTLIGGSATLSFAGLPTTLSIMLASLVSLAVVAHAMFLKSPTTPGINRSSSP